jgi:cytidylate kinase
MSIVTISRGSHSHGKEVAEKVARKLGYECIAREVVLEASEHYNIPPSLLHHAILDAPSVLDRVLQGREKYISYIQAALLEHFRRDNVVYHGLAGHFFVRGIPHVLKVRIIADMEDRIQIVMERDKVSRKEAIRFIKRLDEERAKWSRNLYGIDTSDPSLYDLVIHIRKFTVEDAVDLICQSLQLTHFRTTPESRDAMEDLALAAAVKAALIGVKPDVEVFSEKGIVLVKTRAYDSQEAAVVQDIQSIVQPIQGIKGIKVHVSPVTPYDR